MLLTVPTVPTYLAAVVGGENKNVPPLAIRAFASTMVATGNGPCGLAVALFYCGWGRLG